VVYVVHKRIVAEALARLRNQQTHTLFTGYLCLQQLASQSGQFEDLRPDFRQFFQKFFEVVNHPLGAPYIKPFTEQKASAQNLWLNENVAGSYAPSSLRPGQPFRRVVNIEGKRYSLPPDHAERAFEHLLYSIPVQVADLAVVLYRDFGLRGASMTIEDLVGVFAYEFGYASEPGSEPDEKFRALYSLETAENWEEDWLEVA
jgi:hypothetical protein